ncbi:hypothetical protein VaNZ11_006260 [Volvox africanus]|uniref:Uncharacterized protein n=1 Tax=Volvox africanus TaxID=51714 RepID=A0ABQ5S159_9CHLO|nr:hypothetical protein VaNZ11_006260 [Volvox africanus]
MTGENGASDVDFFDNFNTEPDKQAVTEEVNHKLCEVLTELAENIVDVMIKAEDKTQRQMEGDMEAEFDGVAALAAYNDALAAIMQEKNVTSSAMCALPDEHPLKELFFSAFDPQMFHDLLERFISQVRDRKQGLGDWDAESAEGECDEDHTLE